MNHWALLFATLAVAGCGGNGSDDTSMPAPDPSSPLLAEETLALERNPATLPLAGDIRTSPACSTKPPPVSRDEAPLGTPRRHPADPSTASRAMLGFFPVQGCAPMPRSSEDGPVQVELDGPEVLAATEPLSLTVTFVSRADEAIVLVRPIDGTLEQWRFPFYDLYARDESDGKVYRFAFAGGRCGNINPIGEDDYVVLEPQQSCSDVVHGWGGYLANATLPRAGRYTVWVVYSFCGWDGKGVPLGKDMKREDVYLGVHASNGHPVVIR